MAKNRAVAEVSEVCGTRAPVSPGNWDGASWGRGEPPLGVAPRYLVVPTDFAISDQAAVFVAPIELYPDGFLVRVTAVTRHPQPGSGVFGSNWFGEEWEVERRLLTFDVRFADGRSVSSLEQGGAFHLEASAVGSAPLGMFPLGSSGGGRRAEQAFWVEPLPTAGGVTITFDWPAANIADAKLHLDQDASSSAKGSRPIWRGE